MNHMSCTYDPLDNKLRLYSISRLDAETYAKVKAAGFSWAPQQKLFVAPRWTPEREDLLIELCGEVGDEDTSLVDRAEVRAERFEDYRDKRTADAEGARRAVSAIADNIPLGQPILVGHHSERHARKDAERIEKGMRKAVKMWETANYWKARAAGALHHAKYKELPDVRARRIKGIEADQRKDARTLDQSERFLKVWRTLHETTTIIKKDGSATTFLERAKFIANVDQSLPYGSWSDLDAGKTTPEAVQTLAIAHHEARIARAQRWTAHYENRLAYERALLADSGYVPPPKPKTSAALPLLNYAGEVAYRNRHSGAIVRGVAVGITKAQLAEIHTDYKGTEVSECGTHRIRTAMHVPGNHHGISIVYLTDSKQHPRPGAAEVSKRKEEEQDAFEDRADAKLAKLAARDQARAAKAPEREAEAAKAAPFEALRQSLKTGVKVVVADQLFVTPPALARLMAQMTCGTMAGMRVLEPSAGTGNLVRAIANHALGFDTGLRLTTVEENRALADGLVNLRRLTLCANESNFSIHYGDFLEMLCKDLGGPFDRILMNPPFAKAADIAHILWARTMLKPGALLVAICADGPRQRKELAPLAETYEKLPPDTFKSAGTSVRAVLLTLGAATRGR